MTTAAFLDSLTDKLRPTIDVAAVPVNPLLTILAPPAPATPPAAPQPKRRKMNEYAVPPTTAPAPPPATAPLDRMATLESKRLKRIETQRAEFDTNTKSKSELESKLAQNKSKRTVVFAKLQDNEDDEVSANEFTNLQKERKKLESELSAISLVPPIEWTQEEIDLKSEILAEQAQAAQAKRDAEQAAQAQAEREREAQAAAQIQRVSPVPMPDAKQIETISIQILSERFDEFLRARRARFESFEEEERKDWAKLHADVMGEIKQRTVRMQFLGDLPDPISEISSIASTTSTPPPIQRHASKTTAMPELFATVSKNDKFAGTWSPEPLDDSDERFAWFHTYVEEISRPVGNMSSMSSFSDKQIKTVQRVIAEPTFNEALCIFCGNSEGPQFPLFKDGRVPISKAVSYRATFRAAMVGCGAKHWCHLGCAFIFAQLYAEKHDIQMELPDKLLEADRKWNWMRIKCPRCDSCFTPLSLVASGKSVLPLYPTIQSLALDFGKYYTIQNRVDVPQAEPCVFCNGDVLQDARTIIPQTNNSVVYLACGSYAHLDCAHVQISLNQECVCGKKHHVSESDVI